MDFSGLIRCVSDHPTLTGLIDQIRMNPSGESSSWNGCVLNSAKSFFVTTLHRALDQPVVIITSLNDVAKHLFEQLSIWSNDPANVYFFPEPDINSYEQASWDLMVVNERLQVLNLMANDIAPAPIIVTSIGAVARKTIDSDFFSQSTIEIKPGIKFSQELLINNLTIMGYERDRAIEIPGTFTRRGGIIDVFSPAHDYPIRLDFFGNEIENIRIFDPGTQKSLDTLESAMLIPATEALPNLNEELDNAAGVSDTDVNDLQSCGLNTFSSCTSRDLSSRCCQGADCCSSLSQDGSFFDYLPRNALLVLDDDISLENSYNEIIQRVENKRGDELKRVDFHRTFPKPYFDWDSLNKGMSRVNYTIHMQGWHKMGSEFNSSLDFIPPSNFGGNIKGFLGELRRLLDCECRVVLVTHQAKRLSELLTEADIITSVTNGVIEAPVVGVPTLVQGTLAEGWTLKKGNKHDESPIVLLTDKEIFGFTKQRRTSRKRPVRRELFSSDLTVGDYVVHVDHGIGRFVGVTTMSREEREREYLTIQYADSAKLYVPNDSVDRISAYIGSNDKHPALTRLGTQEWIKAKRKAKASTEEIAKELLALYAKREIKNGYSFSQDTPWLQELEASFPYVETPDQIETIRDVKQDMEQTKPMDRLVCGDVGYGKTEVALRAAFKAVLDGRQVAILVPTTVLAQQHLQTFRERLKAFPVEIEVLSRFRSPKDQNYVLDTLKTGYVDICIGTHRLLQKDVIFKDLGLVIIDEEQRFGVTHKEKLKRIREEVDVLTLSATPIPRTLHMSLVGVRDMSTMETPPAERLPITTYVQEYDNNIVREAISREIERGGQVFFVHNRVQTINSMANRIQKLVPNARVVVGHGQMPEETLERVMLDFSNGNYDLLMCTTIIESGLDMPNVNTIIVDQSERMGLSQLYQLRGRVGRGIDKAYAYFLFDKYKALSEVASKRLQAIQAATELGSGFRIAMKELEIRGAGNLLGVEQSGYITSVGFDLYCSMLSQAIEDLRNQGYPTGSSNEGYKERSSTFVPTVLDLPVPAYLPEEYVSGLDVRVALYQRLTRLNNLVELDNIAEELKDRFGSRPLEADNLISMVRLKLLASARDIHRIATSGDQIVIYLGPDAYVDRSHLTAFGSWVAIGAKQIRLSLNSTESGWWEALEKVVLAVGRVDGKDLALVGQSSNHSSELPLV